VLVKAQESHVRGVLARKGASLPLPVEKVKQTRDGPAPPNPARRRTLQGHPPVPEPRHARLPAAPFQDLRLFLAGNPVATHPLCAATQLDIVSALSVETLPRSESQRRLPLETGATQSSPIEQRMLWACIGRPRDTADAVAAWIKHGASSVQKGQHERLLECAARIRGEFDDRIRFGQGLQSPSETLRLHPGTCRDLAGLMIALARCIGCAARFVTGYVCTPGASAASGVDLTPILRTFTSYGATASLSAGVDVARLR